MYMYSPPTQSELEAQYEKLRVHFNKWARYVGHLGNVAVDKALIIRILQKVHQRKHYYAYFHKGMVISEVKEVGLLAYWVSKYKPYTVLDRSKIPIRLVDNKIGAVNSYEINSSFAAVLIITLCEKFCKSRGKTLRPQKQYIKRLVYGIKNWDLSKEAFMLITDSLCQLVS